MIFDNYFILAQEPLLSDAVRKCPFCKERDMVVKRKKDGGCVLRTVWSIVVVIVVVFVVVFV